MEKVREMDLRSDTVTKPSRAMREAMFSAEVGDDVYGEDPTVRKLEEFGASMFGKEAAIYLPTGTMGNLASVMAHCWKRGQEVLLGDKSHIHLFEQGGMAQIANVHHRTLTNLPDGTFSLRELSDKIRDPSMGLHEPTTALICLENTHNKCGGAVLPLQFIDEVCLIAKGNGLKVHVDGARIFNAAVKQGLPVSRLVLNCDSVSVCLSKGLGCPLGTLVLGNEAFIGRVKRCRKALGGAMRQVGVIAATGLVALNSLIDRLADDHLNATTIAQAIDSCRSAIVSVDLQKVMTNIVVVDLKSSLLSPSQFCDRLRRVTEEEKAVFGGQTIIIKANAWGKSGIRLVTHYDLTIEDTRLISEKLKFIINCLEEEFIE